MADDNELTLKDPAAGKKKKLIIMFNYNDGEGDSWQREM